MTKKQWALTTGAAAFLAVTFWPPWLLVSVEHYKYGPQIISSSRSALTYSMFYPPSWGNFTVSIDWATLAMLWFAIGVVTTIAYKVLPE